MSENTIAQTITDLASPLAASLGLDIWGVDVAFGKRGLVRIFVEGENGVNIDNCAELSRLVGLTLDVEDTLPGAYVLEVSSPGLERAFFTPAQLEKYAGKTVEVSLHEPVAAYPGRKKIMGELVKAENGEFAVLPLDAPKESPVPATFIWDNVKKAKLVHFLPEPEGAVKGRKTKQKTAAGKPGGEKTGE
ncbi:MAG: Ribosome maturation factor RimP [Desulfovibrio sp.]